MAEDAVAVEVEMSDNQSKVKVVPGEGEKKKSPFNMKNVVAAATKKKDEGEDNKAEAGDATQLSTIAVADEEKKEKEKVEEGEDAGKEKTEEEDFWDRAQRLGLDKEEWAKQQSLAATRLKLCWDISLPLLCMILIWIATTKQEPKLVAPPACSKNWGRDYACYQPSDATPPAQWMANKEWRMSLNDRNATTNDTEVLMVTYSTDSVKRLCELDYIASQKNADGTSIFYQTTPSGWKTVLAFIPFVVIFQGILGLSLSSRVVAPFGMFVTLLLGMNFFRDAAYFNGDAVSEALGKVGIIILDRFWWTLIEYALSVFTAFFFLRVLQLWGVVDSMRREFESIAPTPNRKVMMVGFCFAVALAVVAPGGSNFVIAGSILISMNLQGFPKDSPERLNSNLNIGAIALFGNAVTSAYNLLGICVVTLAEDISELDPLKRGSRVATMEIGKFFTLQYLVLGTLSPAIMVFVARPENSVKEKFLAMKSDLVICLIIGAVFAVVQFVIAAYSGPELPCLIGGGVPLLLYILWEKRGNLSFSIPSWQSIKQRRYTIPFVILITILLIYGSEDVANGLTGKGTSAYAYLSPLVFEINSGDVSFSRRFSYLYDSGVVIFFIALATPFILPYVQTSNDDVSQIKSTNSPFTGQVRGVPTRELKNRVKKALMMSRASTAFVPDKLRIKATIVTAFKEAWEDVVPVLLSITSFASIARLMNYFEMTQAIASFIVSIFSKSPMGYAFFMPVIGMLGSGLTGSTTTSNFLFARLQISTCQTLGLLQKNSLYEVAGLQILGASAGEIISPMNAVVITLMDGIVGGEAPLIKRLLLIFVMWLLTCCFVSLCFLSA